MDTVSTLGIITTLVPALLTGVPSISTVRGVATPNSVRTDVLLRPMHAPSEIELTSSQPGLDPVDFLRAKANEFALLEDGWDGDTSVAPSQASVAAALGFIDRLPGGLPLPGIMVSSQGEIGFYWDLNGGYADISFSSAGEGSFFSRTPMGQEEFFDELAVASLDRKWFFDRLGAMAAPHRRVA